MTESPEMQQPSHAAQIDALLKAMEAETHHYENSPDSMKDVRLNSSLMNLLDSFATLPLTPADKAYADDKAMAATTKNNELNDRLNQLKNIASGANVVDPLQSPEYEQALIEGDHKKATKLEAAARQLRIDRTTASQQIKALTPPLQEARKAAAFWGRIARAVSKSLFLQELNANQLIFNDLLERLLPVWADMNRLCELADLKAKHPYQLKTAFNMPMNRHKLAPGLEQVMSFELQRRPF